MSHIHLHSKHYFVSPIMLIASAIALLSALTSTTSAQCVDPSKIDADAVCMTLYDPVCGCDNVTYSNSCVANASGVLSYTAGACPVDDMASFFLDTDTILVGDTVQIGWNAKCKCAIDWSRYEAVSIQYYVANSIGDGNFVGLLPGVAEIRITDRQSKVTATLFLTVASSNNPVSSYYLSYLPINVTKDGMYTVLLAGKMGLDCCNTHTLSAVLTDKYTITLSVSSTKMNCPTQDVCTADIQTTISNLPLGEYTITYPTNPFIHSIGMQLGDTTSSQVYKMRPSNTIVRVGQSVTLKTVDNSAVDWTKFAGSTSNGGIATVSSDGVIRGIKQGRTTIIVKEISTGATNAWDIYVDSEASLFTKDSIVMLVGQTAQLPINQALIEDFIINDMSTAIITVDTLSKSIVAHAVGDDICLSYNRNTGTVDTLKIIVKEPIPPTTQITSVTVLNNGYTLEVTFDKPVTLYEAMEQDFVIAQDNRLKASSGYVVSRVSCKVGDPKTLVLIMSAPVPASGITVQLQDLKSYTVATNHVVESAGCIEISPNPAHNTIWVTADGLISVKIIDTAGQLVASAQALNDQTELDISHLPAGIYRAVCQTVSVEETLVFVVE